MQSRAQIVATIGPATTTSMTTSMNGITQLGNTIGGVFVIIGHGVDDIAAEFSENIYDVQDWRIIINIDLCCAALGSSSRNISNG